MYGKVFGGTPNILMFWIFPENVSISERTVNRALIVSSESAGTHQKTPSDLPAINLNYIL